MKISERDLCMFCYFRNKMFDDMKCLSCEVDEICDLFKEQNSGNYPYDLIEEEPVYKGSDPHKVY